MEKVIMVLLLVITEEGELEHLTVNINEQFKKYPYNNMDDINFIIDITKPTLKDMNLQPVDLLGVYDRVLDSTIWCQEDVPCNNEISR